MTRAPDLQLATLLRSYAEDPNSVERTLRDVHTRTAESPSAVWIHRAPFDSMRAALTQSEERRRRGEHLPLFGVPFAVKDNIDVAGVPTTAACPAFSYVPERSAPVVERLLDAGAIVVGKTNLDQFATGLVGVRSPYGACENPFDSRFITGGSSSGSAVAVATGLVSFALGTDTAGSGRVPAAFQNIVGFKPSRGLLSTRGVVPACRSLDCVSIFAANSADVGTVFDVAAAFDALDPFSRQRASRSEHPSTLRVGVPRASQLEFFGNSDSAKLFLSALTKLDALEAERVEIDFEPFAAAAELLYGGPWVAERLHATARLLDEQPEAFDQIVGSILKTARSVSALDVFQGIYRLRECARRTESEWARMDLLLLPTAPTIYTMREIAEEPIERNRRLGHYTNFVNLLDLCAIAVPAGFYGSSLPFGVSFIGKTGTDDFVLSVGARFHALSLGKVGATQALVHHTPTNLSIGGAARRPRVRLAVVGAHLTGEPLNHELTSRGATFVRACRTAAEYRLYALANTVPAKPGLMRDPSFRGAGIEVEVWELGHDAFGSFVDAVPPPLAIGSVALDDGSSVNGFVCEAFAIAHATEITEYGGWRAYSRRASGSDSR